VLYTHIYLLPQAHVKLLRPDSMCTQRTMLWFSAHATPTVTSGIRLLTEARKKKKKNTHTHTHAQHTMLWFSAYDTRYMLHPQLPQARVNLLRPENTHTLMHTRTHAHAHTHTHKHKHTHTHTHTHTLMHNTTHHALVLCVCYTLHATPTVTSGIRQLTEARKHTHRTHTHTHTHTLMHNTTHHALVLCVCCMLLATCTVTSGTSPLTEARKHTHTHAHSCTIQHTMLWFSAHATCYMLHPQLPQARVNLLRPENTHAHTHSCTTHHALVLCVCHGHGCPFLGKEGRGLLDVGEVGCVATLRITTVRAAQHTVRAATHSERSNTQ